MSETVHVRTGSGTPFGPHGDPENGENCSDTLCAACGCCCHCQHQCDCPECGCSEFGHDDDRWPSKHSDPGLLATEVKRLRVQLGCVKTLATLWEERADKAAKELEDDLSDLSRGFTAGSARAYRVHADALRNMLGDD